MKTFEMKYILSVICIAIFSLSGNTQIKTPSTSPLTTITQKVGITDVKLTYYRPSVKERDIFSKEGLVPLGEYWRTGANSPTTFSFSDDVTIGGNKLAAGEYVLLTKPNETAWHIMLYEKTKGGWNTYIDRKPKLLVSASKYESPFKIESLMIFIENIKMKSAEIVIYWNNTYVRIPFEVEVHDKVMSSIDKVMQGPSDIEYFQAASYLYKVDQDLDKALEYIQKAANGDNPTFFFSRREATILAKLGRYEEAISSARRSYELGVKAGNIDIMKLNDKSILEWSKLLNDRE